MKSHPIVVVFSITAAVSLVLIRFGKSDESPPAPPVPESATPHKNVVPPAPTPQIPEFELLPAPQLGPQVIPFPEGFQFLPGPQFLPKNKESEQHLSFGTPTIIHDEKFRTVIVLPVKGGIPDADQMRRAADLYAAFDIVRCKVVDKFVHNKLEQVLLFEFKPKAGFMILIIEYRDVNVAPPPPPPNNKPWILPNSNLFSV